MKRSGALKRTRAKVVYRQLQPGEERPAGTPRRYTDGRGYVRLRWKVGKNEYVEVYEHRFVVGVPPVDVHHIDHNKSHNDPTNLEPLSRVDHAKQHGAEKTAASRSVNEWAGYKSQAAYEKAMAARERKAGRRVFLEQISALYGAGKTAAEIGQSVGRHPGTISTVLRSAGVVSRHPTGRNTDISGAIRQIVHARAKSCCEKCGANLAWSPRQVHHRRPRQMGGSRRAETNLPGNLVLLCVECHAWIEANRTAATGYGWLVPSWSEAVSIPITHNAYGLCYLLNDGSWSANPVPLDQALVGPARRTEANPIDPDEIRRLHAEGVRASEIMRLLGVSRPRLYRTFDDLGLERFGPGRPPAGDGNA